jgi:hypothetical protein
VLSLPHLFQLRRHPKARLALPRFSSAYRASGVDFVANELPDQLAVVCEFAATCDLPTGLRLLEENRVGIELLRAALADARSPYLDAIEAVRAVLPDPGLSPLFISASCWSRSDISAASWCRKAPRTQWV